LNEELETKTERITAMLERENLDAVLINAQHNFAWLTAGGNNGVDLSRENGVASLLVTRDGRRFVLASNIEIERMIGEQVSANDFTPIEYRWQDEKSDPHVLIDKGRSVLAPHSKLASDILIDTGVPAIENKIGPCRHQLTGDEIVRYRELGLDAATAFGNLIGNIKPGESEIELAERLRHELGLRGITSVVTLVAADERISRFRHPVPTSNRWNDALMLVACAKRGGLIVSLSRIICAGEISTELRTRTEAAAYVNARLMSGTHPETTGAELYKIAAEAYAVRGFANEINLHHQGGATGYKTREWVAHPKSIETVRMNQAFAWNPSITGTKVEETGVVTDNGFELITPTPGFPQIAVQVDGVDYFSPGILSLSKGASA
jgi:Xaa-Pro aminopeptidase